MPVTCSALGDLHIYTKHMIHDQHYDQHYYITEPMINIIISLKGLQKISALLCIRDGLYINLLLPVTGTTGIR